MLTTDLTLGTFNNPFLAGKFGDYDFRSSPYVDFSDIKTQNRKKGNLVNAMGAYLPKGADIDAFNQLSPEVQSNLLMLGYLEKQNDPEVLRRRRREEIQDLDELQGKQMARAQKYGKESAFYGFMYDGLPKLMAQAAFSRYAFAPEMVKGVQDAYSRIDLAGAVKPSGRQTYMTVNPMGGIG